MKRFLCLGALAAMTFMAGAQEWTKPEPAKFVAQAEILTEESTDTAFYYLYLKDAKAFYCAGNAYGTQASIGNNGLKVFFKACKSDDASEWDGKTVNVYNWFKNSWKNLFTDTEQAAYVDRAAQPNYFYETEQGENGVIRICNSTLNPVFNSTPKKQYLGLDLTFETSSTVLYPTITDAEDGFEDVMLDWQLVGADEYENGTYGSAMTIYNAAVELGELIKSTKEKHPDVDISAQEAVYANTASTEAELKEAFSAIHSAIFQSIVGEASQENPVNISIKAFSQLNIAYDFNDKNIIGWTSTTGANVNAANNGNAAADIAATGNHYENWAPAAFTGKMYATAKNLPAGMYKVEALTYAKLTYADAEGVWFYANDQRVKVGTSLIELGREQSVTVILNELGEIEFGLDIIGEDNWVGLDNVYIFYYGEILEDPDKILLEETVKSAEATYNLSNIHANNDVMAAYEKALKEAKNATDSHAELLANLNAAIENLRTSIADYTTLAALSKKAYDLSFDLESSFPDLAMIIGDFYMVWEEQYNYDMTYTSTEIAPLNDLLDKTIADYISQNVQPGDEISVLIKNNSFDKDISGWDVTGRTPAWGGISTNTQGTLSEVTLTSGCAEVWRASFSMSQTINALPAGVYAFSCQALENDYTNSGSIATVLYALTSNSDVVQKKQIPAINDYATAEQLFSDGTGWDDQQTSDGLWIPTGMPGANYHFYNDQDDDGFGDYTVSFNVVLTERADVTFGIKNDMVDRWAIFDNFRLIYLGQDMGAYEEIVAGLIQQAAKINNDADASYGMGEDARERLTAAQAAAEAAATAEEYVAAIDEFRTAIAHAVRSVELYAELNSLLDLLIAKSYESTNAEAIDEAETLINDIITVTNEFTCTNEQAEEYTKHAEKMLVMLAIPGNYKEASDSNPADFTSMIPNADIEQGAGVAWIANKPNGGNGPVLASGINGQSMEYWCGNAANGAFDYYQSLGAGLPEGTYQLTAKIANSYSDLLEVHEDVVTTDGEIGLYAKVDDTEYYEMVPTQTALCTEAWEMPVATFTVKEGQEVVIGVKNYETMTARWTVIDDFILTYFGKESDKEDSPSTGIENIEHRNPQVETIGIYDLQGHSLQSLRKGINIVRMSDGSVRKVYVKQLQ